MNNPETRPPSLLFRLRRFLHVRLGSLCREGAGILRQILQWPRLSSGHLLPQSQEMRMMADHYTSSSSPDCATRWKSGVVAMLDGRIFHGGPTDRLRGILSLYREARRRNLPFHIYWISPFPLERFLIPNAVDWRIAPEQIATSAEAAFPVIVDDMRDRESLIRVRAALRAPVFQWHFYTNADFARGEYATLFRELFRPSQLLEREVAIHRRQLGEKYYAFTFRFLQLLGDFKDWDKRVLPEEEKSELMERVAGEFRKIAGKLEPDRRILLTSDSRRFLDFMSDKDPRIYVVPGEIRNIDQSDEEAPDAWLKTFVDQQLLMGATDVWLMRTGSMYRSGFPRFAAEVGGARFIDHIF